MPLKRGYSRATISQNISELHSGPTYARMAALHGPEAAQKQSIAIAMRMARALRKLKKGR